MISDNLKLAADKCNVNLIDDVKQKLSTTVYCLIFLYIKLYLLQSLFVICHNNLFLWLLTVANISGWLNFCFEPEESSEQDPLFPRLKWHLHWPIIFRLDNRVTMVYSFKLTKQNLGIQRFSKIFKFVNTKHKHNCRSKYFKISIDFFLSSFSLSVTWTMSWALLVARGPFDKL